MEGKGVGEGIEKGGLRKNDKCRMYKNKIILLDVMMMSRVIFYERSV